MNENRHCVNTCKQLITQLLQYFRQVQIPTYDYRIFYPLYTYIPNLRYKCVESRCWTNFLFYSDEIAMLSCLIRSCSNDTLKCGEKSLRPEIIWTLRIKQFQQKKKLAYKRAFSPGTKALAFGPRILTKGYTFSISFTEESIANLSNWLVKFYMSLVCTRRAAMGVQKKCNIWIIRSVILVHQSAADQWMLQMTDHHKTQRTLRHCQLIIHSQPCYMLSFAHWFIM